MWKFVFAVYLLQAPLYTLQDAVVESQILRRLLDKYDATSRPTNKTQEPALVTINTFVRDVFNYELSEQKTSIELTYREQWNDPRLAYNDPGVRYIFVREPQKIWVPDIFFSNSKKGYFHNLMEPNILMRLYPNGDILYSRRVTVQIHCETNWKRYPFGKVICPIIAASYGYTTEDVIVQWKATNPIQISKMVSNSPQMNWQTHFTETCTSKTNTGEYGCIKVNFVFKRPFCHFFLALFFPALVSTLLGWLTFWIDRRKASGSSLRLTLLILCVALSSGSWIISIIQSPVTFETNATHVWTSLNFLFVVYALVHYYAMAGVACCQKLCGIYQRTSTYEEEKNCVALVMNPIDDDVDKNGKAKDSMKPFSADGIRHAVTKTTNRPDVIGRIFYPSVYILFNIIYWAVYKE